VITAYCSNCKSVDVGDLSRGTLRDDVMWIDLIEPSREEELFVEKALGIEVPTRDDLKDIEPSARLYVENDAVFMTASLVWKAETDAPTLTDVAFILAGKRLVTIRYAQPKSFALFIAALHRVPQQWRSGAALLAKLFETIIDRTAEILEQSVARIDILSTHVFGDRARKVRKPSATCPGTAACASGSARGACRTGSRTWSRSTDRPSCPISLATYLPNQRSCSPRSLRAWQVAPRSCQWLNSLPPLSTPSDRLLSQSVH